jgi:hypothetical protein
MVTVGTGKSEMRCRCHRCTSLSKGTNPLLKAGDASHMPMAFRAVFRWICTAEQTGAATSAQQDLPPVGNKMLTIGN